MKSLTPFFVHGYRNMLMYPWLSPMATTVFLGLTSTAVMSASCACLECQIPEDIIHFCNLNSSVFTYLLPALDLGALVKFVGRTFIALVTYSRYVVKSR